MTAGDVTVQVIENWTTALIDTAMTSLRASANDKWMIQGVANGKNMLIVHIEEA